MTRRKAFTIHGEPELLGNWFNVYYGQRELHSKEWLDPGDAMIVSSSGEYNGCYGFFDFGQLIKPPFATVPSTGSIGVSFVQRLPCGVTDDCLLLLPKEGIPEEALYIAAAVVRLERWRFSYGRKITPQRIARFKMPDPIGPIIDWIKRRRKDTERLGRQIIESMADKQGTGLEFRAILDQWERERPRGQNVASMAAHPIYQRIVSMGQRAVPLLLLELSRKPGHWFVALNAITGENPVLPEDEGNLKRMATTWVEWGKKRGYVSDLD